jgi:transcriptional regulator with XRE-family HTH domain
MLYTDMTSKNVGGTLADRFNAALAKRGVRNKSDLARAVGTNPTRILRYADGTRKRVEAEMGLKLAAALGVSAKWLASGEGDPQYEEDWKGLPGAFESGEVDLVEHRRRIADAGGSGERDVYPDREAVIIALGDELDQSVLRLLLLESGPEAEGRDYAGWLAKAKEIKAKVEWSRLEYKNQAPEAPPGQRAPALKPPSPPAKRGRSLGHRWGPCTNPARSRTQRARCSRARPTSSGRASAAAAWARSTRRRTSRRARAERSRCSRPGSRAGKISRRACSAKPRCSARSTRRTS